MDALVIAAEAAQPISDLKSTIGTALYSFLIVAFAIMIVVTAFKQLKGAGRWSTLVTAFALTALFAIPPAGDGVLNFFGNLIQNLSDQGNSALEEN